MTYQARSALVFLIATLCAPIAAADTSTETSSDPATQADSDAAASMLVSGLLVEEAADTAPGSQTEIGQSRRSRRSRARRARARRARRARARRSRARRSRARGSRARRSRARAHDRDEDYEDYDDEDFDDEDLDRRRRRARADRERSREERERSARERREERRARRELDERYEDPDVRPPPTVDLHVGARIQGRLARFETGDGNAHRNDVAYPALTALLRARPLSSETGLERGFEVRGSFNYAVGLRSRNTLTDEPVETEFWSFYFDGAMMFEVDPAVQLGLGLGFGFDAFNFGEQALVIVPSAEYAYLRPHIRGRFQIADELAVFELELAYRGVLSRGALSEHFGNEGETQGFDVGARLGGSLDMGLSYGIEAGFTGYFHFFQGDAITAPGQTGTDFSLWLGVQVGYAFR